MQRSRSSKFPYLALIFALVVPTSGSLVAQENTKIIWVAHFKADCVGVAPQKCYLIKDNMYDPWIYWYNEIERLDWQKGYAYEVVVAEEKIDNPPADASSINLRVVELLTMINAGAQPAGALPLELRDLPAEGQPLSGNTPIVEEEVVETRTASPPAPVAPPPAAPPTTPQPDSPVSTPPPVAPPPPAPSAASTPVPAPKVTPIPKEETQLYRGHLTIGVGLETRAFRICNSEGDIWIEDQSTENLWRTYRELSGYPNRPVFMVVRGDLGPAPASGLAANYKQQLIVTELEEAATEGLGCTAPNPEVVAVATPVAGPITEVAVEVAESEFVAFGNEPFWRVEISERGIIFAQAGGAEYGFPYKEPFASDTKWVYWGTLEQGIPHKIQVAIEKQICRDTMADAQYSYTATVTFDERKLSGCARRGPVR